MIRKHPECRYPSFGYSVGLAFLQLTFGPVELWGGALRRYHAEAEILGIFEFLFGRFGVSSFEPASLTAEFRADAANRGRGLYIITRPARMNTLCAKACKNRVNLLSEGLVRPHTAIYLPHHPSPGSGTSEFKPVPTSGVPESTPKVLLMLPSVGNRSRISATSNRICHVQRDYAKGNNSRKFPGPRCLPAKSE